MLYTRPAAQFAPANAKTVDQQRNLQPVHRQYNSSSFKFARIKSIRNERTNNENADYV